LVLIVFFLFSNALKGWWNKGVYTVGVRLFKLAMQFRLLFRALRAFRATPKCSVIVVYE